MWLWCAWVEGEGWRQMLTERLWVGAGQAGQDKAEREEWSKLGLIVLAIVFQP